MGEYLYRVHYNEILLYEGTDGVAAKHIANLMENQDDISIKRAQLEWWPVPPEIFEDGEVNV